MDKPIPYQQFRQLKKAAGAAFTLERIPKTRSFRTVRVRESTQEEREAGAKLGEILRTARGRMNLPDSAIATSRRYRLLAWALLRGYRYRSIEPHCRLQKRNGYLATSKAIPIARWLVDKEGGSRGYAALEGDPHETNRPRPSLLVAALAELGVAVETFEAAGWLAEPMDLEERLQLDLRRLAGRRLAELFKPDLHVRHRFPDRLPYAKVLALEELSAAYVEGRIDLQLARQALALFEHERVPLDVSLTHEGSKKISAEFEAMKAARATPAAE